MRRRFLLGLGGLLAAAFAALLVTTILALTAPANARTCAGAASLDYSCYLDRYQQLSHATGPPAALADLMSARTDNAYLRSVCHQVSHVIGRAAGEQRSLPDAFADFDGVTGGEVICSGGYFHGVVEGLMGRMGADEAVVRARDVCAGPRSEEPAGPRAYYCAHGMGHGFMALHGGDVHASLAACERLDPWEAEQCIGGVFMENVSAVGNVRPADPLYPCADVATRFRTACYDRQTAYAVDATGEDFATVFRLCAAVDPAFRPACDQGVGGEIALYSGKFLATPADQATSIRSLCLLAAAGAPRADCVTGAVAKYVREHSRTAQSEALCSAVREPGTEELVGACDAALAGAAATLREAPAVVVEHGH